MIRSFFTYIFISAATLCGAQKPVLFKNPVNTTGTLLSGQERKVYTLPEVGVYASNEFDGARLSGFVLKNDSTAFVIIHPENTPINNSAYYAFNIWADTIKTFYCAFQYPEGYSHRYIPKLKINNVWVETDSSHLSTTREGLSAVRLRLGRSPLTVAAQEIHDSNDVGDWCANLVKDKTAYVRMESVGKSVRGRDIPVLDISIGDNEKKEVIVLLTRQHPPEVTGYLAFQSFLTTLLDGSALSERFLKKYRVLAFPIMNPDGVDDGHWRHNAMGVDLNRDWAVYNQPEVRQVVRFIDGVLEKDHSRLILGIDFHATWYDVFYTNKEQEHTTLPHFSGHWFTALEEHIPGYSVNEQTANSTKPVSKAWFLYRHDAVGITYEVGDDTPRDSIAWIGRVAAQQMERILLHE